MVEDKSVEGGLQLKVYAGRYFVITKVTANKHVVVLDQTIPVHGQSG